MKKLLAVLLCTVMVLTPVLSLAESWADFVTRANTLMATGNDETITLTEAVDAAGYSDPYLEWLGGGTLTLVGQGGATPDFGNMHIGNASIYFENVWVKSDNNDAIWADAPGGHVSLYADAGTVIEGVYHGIDAATGGSFSLVNEGSIAGGSNAGLFTLNFDGPIVLINFGTISGRYGMSSHAGEVFVYNDGLIQGTEFGLSLSGETTTVINNGEIVATDNGRPDYSAIHLYVWPGDAVTVQNTGDLVSPAGNAPIAIHDSFGDIQAYPGGPQAFLAQLDLPVGTVVRILSWQVQEDDTEKLVYNDYVVSARAAQATPQPLHNRGKVNGIAYSKEWLTTTYFGISLESFFLDGNDTRVNHRSQFKMGKGNAISGTLRTSKVDAGMQYLVTPDALENLRRANVRSLVLRNGSEYHDPRTTIDIIAVLDALNALPPEIRGDIRYLLFTDKGMDGEALYVDWQGNVKTMEGVIVRTFSQSTLESFPDFGRN